MHLTKMVPNKISGSEFIPTSSELSQYKGMQESIIQKEIKNNRLWVLKIRPKVHNFTLSSQ